MPSQKYQRIGFVSTKESGDYTYPEKPLKSTFFYGLDPQPVFAHII